MIKGFIIPNAADVHEELVEYAEKGALRGRWLGFENLHKRYTIAYPGVTDWTGFPSSGKTQVVLELLYNVAAFYGDKSLIYAPDIGTRKEILSDLIHIHSGRTFDRRFKNKIDEQTIAQATPWIMEHFVILEKEDPKAKITPYQFWDLAVEMKKERGIKNALIDSWKDMSHTREREFGRTDQYLEDVLSYRNMVAEKEKLHFHTIIHPLKTDKDGAGKRKAPGPYDLKGGSEWYNNGKVIATAHRPEGSQNEVDIYFHKIKPRSIGSPGKATLYFDARIMKYYLEEVDGSRLYASDKPRKLKSAKIQDAAVKPKATQAELDIIDENEIPF